MHEEKAEIISLPFRHDVWLLILGSSMILIAFVSLLVNKYVLPLPHAIVESKYKQLHRILAADSPDTVIPTEGLDAFAQKEYHRILYMTFIFEMVLLFLFVSLYLTKQPSDHMKISYIWFNVVPCFFMFVSVYYMQNWQVPGVSTFLSELQQATA